MVKYHINPETGKASRCNATVRDCLFSVDGRIPQHYNSIQEAQTAFENKNIKNQFESISKKSTNKNLSFQENYEKKKQDYHKQQEDIGRKRKEKEIELEAKKREREKEADRRKRTRIKQGEKIETLSQFESLLEKEETLKDDKKKIEEYIDLLEQKSFLSRKIERASMDVILNTPHEKRELSRLSLKDAELFEKNTHQEEYKKLLEIRKEVKRKSERNPFAFVKNISADMRGTITKEHSLIRKINHRINEIYTHSYVWRITEEQKEDWKQFESSIDHLLEDDEK